MTRRRTGFVLLMVLVLVVVAGTMLAGLARHSAAGAVVAQQAVEDLQRRWAVTTCRATLLPRAETIFGAAEGRDAAGDGYSTGMRVSEVRATCRLGGQEYELVFTDEQAKFNPNGTAGGARAELRAAVERLAVDPRRVHVRPGPIVGFGQLFDGASPGDLVGRTAFKGNARSITCWSDGRVNVRRAPAAAIEETCRDLLPPDAMAALLDARHRAKVPMVHTLLEKLKLTEQQRAALTDRLTNRSACQGLWVIAHGSRRSWHTFAAAVTDTESDPQNRTILKQYCFAW